MRIAVTGAAGFIGRHLLAELANAGHFVVGVSRRPVALPHAAETRAGDLLEESTWRALSSVDAIVHLGGIADASLSYGRPLEYNVANAVGTLLGLEEARRQAALFVLASSQRVYRPGEAPLAEDAPRAPVDPYGFSKLVAEQWVAMYRQVYDQPASVLRFFSVYGPGQMPGAGASGVVALFASRALRGEDLVVHGLAWRDFTYAGDVAAGIRLAVEQRAAWGKDYNIATGLATSTEELARAVVGATASHSVIRVEPPAKPAESYVADITRARGELGFSPAVPLPQGLERYVQWLREQR